MRKAILVLMLGTMAAAPAHAERFAISCSGTVFSGFQGPPGRPMTGTTRDIRNIVYVIDEEAQTVERFIPAQGKLDGVCNLKGLSCSRSFSATRITLAGETAEGYRTVIGFDWDRQTGKLETIFDVFGANGAGMASRWSLKCVPTEIPDIGAAAK